jgi:hypothetical protein
MRRKRPYIVVGFSVKNFLKVHSFQFESAHLLISSSPGERKKVRRI